MDRAWAVDGPVLRLEVGQPDTAPPDHVLAAMTAAIAAHDTGYTPNAGIPQLREACADKLGRVNGIARSPDEILVVAGSMQGLSAVFLALARPGGRVLVPEPGWPNYAMACQLVGVDAQRYPLRADDGFRPDLDVLEHLIDDRTIAVVVNSPSNPLGTVIPAEDLGVVQQLCQRRGAWVISDECYDEIVHDTNTAASPAAPPDTDNVIAIHSFSKTYAMTGLRIGYVSAARPVIRTLTTMQEALVACVNGPAQHAALAALTGPQDFVAQRREVYRRRRDRAIAAASALGIPHVTPAGAFYLWLPLGQLMGDPADTMAFCVDLIDRQRVALAPGETFGPAGAGAVRLSLAAADHDIVSGIGRLADHVGRR
jgi:aspartate aminotransferase